MKQIYTALTLAILTTACGTSEQGTATESVKPQTPAVLNPVATVATIDNDTVLNIADLSGLPVCEGKSEGKIVYVKSEKRFQTCSQNEWSVVELNLPTGQAGKDGIDGLVGATGAQGVAGTVGAQGIQGVAGTNGPTVVTSIQRRLQLPLSHLNAVASHYLSGYSSAVLADLNIRTMSDGSRCIRGRAWLNQTTAPYSDLQTEIPDTCAAGEFRFPIVWHYQHGLSVLAKSDGTFRAQAGDWTNVAMPNWGTEFTPALVVFTTPIP